MKLERSYSGPGGALNRADIEIRVVSQTLWRQVKHFPFGSGATI